MLTRRMAILPQMPAIGRTALRKEERLVRAAELAVRRQDKARLEAVKIPQFSTMSSSKEVLDAYAEKRPLLAPVDAAAAYFAVSKMSQSVAFKRWVDPLASDPNATELRADLALCAPYLQSGYIASSLLAAAYTHSKDEALISALISAASEKASDLFSLKDVSRTVYALGWLNRPDEVLLPKLLSRVANEAPVMHAIEMTMTLNGLARLQIAPPTALAALAKAAVPKINFFGAKELPQLLSALAALGHHDEDLVRMAISRLPLLLADMDGKAISSFSAALASSTVWVPLAVQQLADETSLKAHMFTARQATMTLGALSRMRWDHTPAVNALVHRIVECTRKRQAALTDIATAVRAISRSSEILEGLRSPSPRLAEQAQLEDALPSRAMTSTSSNVPSELHSSAVPVLLDAAAAILERQMVCISNNGDAPAVDATSSAAGMSAHLEEEMLADLSTLCNGAVQLNVAPPPKLVTLVRTFLESMHASGRVAALGSAAANDSGGDPERQEREARSTARRARRIRAQLADALQRWEESATCNRVTP